MQLLVIRHARAAEANGGSDSQRPLTDLGRSEFEAAASKIANSGSVPQHIYHSPARRTTETAEILASCLGLAISAREMVPWLTLGSGCDDILPMLNELPAEVTAIVGHEPAMSALASAFVGGGWFKFLPGTVACIEFETLVIPGTGQLLWMLDPQPASSQ